jgi:hypothetical protein
MADELWSTTYNGIRKIKEKAGVDLFRTRRLLFVPRIAKSLILGILHATLME